MWGRLDLDSDEGAPTMTGLGPRQRAVLAALEENETGLSARDTAQEMFGGDDDAWNHDPLESEIRSAIEQSAALSVAVSPSVMGIRP